MADSSFLLSELERAHAAAAANGLQLGARIFRHKSDVVEGATRLSVHVDNDDPAAPVFKPFVFAMGPDGVDGLIAQLRAADGASVATVVRRFMISLGIGGAWIDHVLSLRFNFSIVLVPTVERADAAVFPATWAGLFRCVVFAHPELAEAVAKFSDAVSAADAVPRLLSDRGFLERYGSVERVDKAEISTDRSVFMTPRRFLTESPREFADFRVLLWTWFGCNPQFTGDGVTEFRDEVTGATSRGFTECLIPNWPMSEMAERLGATVLRVDVASSSEANM